MKIINNKDGIFVELPKDKITFCGDNEEDKKRNELLYDLSLENDGLQQKIKELEEEIRYLKNDNNLYQGLMDVVKAALHKSGFICQTVTKEEVENCDAEFVVTHRDDETIELYKKMVLGEFDENE